MKNVSKILMFIFISGICLVSCQKEELNQTLKSKSQEIDIYFNSKFLTFKTIESYKKTIGDLSDEKTLVNLKQINENPLRNLKTATGLDEDLYPEFLLTILNEDKIVQIGEWIIKVDMEKNVLSVINEKNSELIDNLIDGVANEKIYHFSTDDDVLDLLEEGSTGTINKPQLKGLFCSDRQAISFNEYKYVSGGSEFRGVQIVQCRYFKSGIYYSLFARVSNSGDYYAGESANLTMVLRYTFYDRCGRSYDRERETQTTITNYASAERMTRVYESSWNLQKYTLTTNFTLQYYLTGLYKNTIYSTVTVNSGL